MTQPMVMPMLLMLILTMLVWCRLFYLRLTFFIREKVNPEIVRYKRPDYPMLAEQASANFINLFEVPVVFYAVSLLIITLGKGDAVYQGLAWVFVGMRVAHSLIHCTYNRIRHRFGVYALSCLVVWAMVLRLLYQQVQS